MIFDRCWLYVGHESGDPEAGRLPGPRLLVGNRPPVYSWARPRRRQAGLLQQLRRYRGALVCRVPEGNTKGMSCFYHAWTYGSTGALNGLPGEEGYGPTFDRARMGLLLPDKVDSYRGFVFACFDPGAVDLGAPTCKRKADYIDLVADQAEVMEVVPGAHEYSADANWKLFVENSLDGYHLLPVHITYFEYLEKVAGSRPNLGSLDEGNLNEAVDLGNGHAAVKIRGPWARPVARWTPALGEHNRERVEAVYAELVRKHGPDRADLIGRVDRNVMIFPNLIILDVMGVVIRKLAPTSAGHAKITQWSLATAGEGADMRARRLENFITFQGPGASRRRMTLRGARSPSYRPGGRTGRAGACPGPTSPCVGNAPRTRRPVSMPQLRREANARLLATVAHSDERVMTLPYQSVSRQTTNAKPATTGDESD